MRLFWINKESKNINYQQKQRLDCVKKIKILSKINNVQTLFGSEKPNNN